MEIAINTAQNVDIAFKPAGLLNRIAATIIDLSLLGGIFLIFCVIFTATIHTDTNRGIAAIILLILLLSYHLICELTMNGRSVGKLTLHLRVVRLDGKKLSFWNCMLRWVFRLIDITATSGILAMLSIIISSKMQRIGDLAAGTTVIYERSTPSLQQLSYYDTPEDYQVTFPQVTILSDRDIHIIREVLQEVEKNHEFGLLEPLALKIKEQTGIQTQMNNLQMVQTVLQDYLHLTKES